VSDSAGQQDPVAIGGDGVLRRFRPDAAAESTGGATIARVSHVVVLPRRAALAIVVAVTLGSCQATAVSPVPAASSPASVVSSAAPSSGPSASVEASSPPVAGQTDTDWGRIWDSLPAGFPRYPGSAPGEEAATGPASAVLVVKAQGDAKTIADWIQSRLEVATYGATLAGPREDGSFVLDAVGPAPGCRVEVTVAPLGGLTTLTVLYGAACPSP
jgi:hypothetical protein